MDIYFLLVFAFGFFFLIWKWLDVRKHTKTAPDYAKRMTMFYLFSAFTFVVGLNSILAEIIFKLLVFSLPLNIEWISLFAFAILCLAAMFIFKTKDSSPKNISNKNTVNNYGNVKNQVNNPTIIVKKNNYSPVLIGLIIIVVGVGFIWFFFSTNEPKFSQSNEEQTEILTKQMEALGQVVKNYNDENYEQRLKEEWGFTRNQLEKALPRLRKIARKDIDKGNIELFSENYGAAIKNYNNAITINPTIPAHFNKGFALAKLGNHNAAIGSFDDVLAIDSNDAEAHYNKGVALGNLGKHNDAIASFDDVLAIDFNNVDAHYNKGVALAKLGKHNAAIGSFDDVLAIDSNNAKAHLYKGVALVNLGKHNAAIASFDDVLAIDSNNIDAHYNKGVALAKLGKHNAAIGSFDDVLTIDFNNVDAHINKGVALVNLGKHNAAIASFDDALAIDSSNVDAHTNKGVVLKYLNIHDN